MPGLPLRFALAALAAGVVAAVVLPENRLGLGVLVVALALAAAAKTARADGSATETPDSLADAVVREGTSPLWRRAWGATAITLAGAAILRDATWVVLPALAGGLGFGSLAVAGGTSWAGIARGLLSAVQRSPAGPLLVARTAAAAVPAGSTPRFRPIARGAGLAVVLLSVFGVLFVSGDAAFAQLAEDALPRPNDADVLALRGLLFALAVAVAGGLALARLRGARDHEGPPRGRLGTGEWLVALVALDVLVAAFVGVQLAVLFGDNRHVLETAGLTYSEYARQGFGQLLVAAALTLADAGAALRYSPPGRRAGIRLALGVLSALTLVVLASALHRLGLYEDAYGATRQRFAAGAAILFVGTVLLLVLGALASGRFAWLPRGTAAAAAVALIAFVAVNPDLRIAERNLGGDQALALDRPGQHESVDTAYLRGLSADAAPALPPRLARRPPPDGLFGWNLSRARAR
ncbi:MAG: hypothetical protein AVDCRST_MAG85-2140 [uncultured Solirubrobacteraceae bacterium]|uniref:Uncharacterized protein n=1 Tax=uncultured Solirubrobacteraceae bacterium TaxID=1162706 RepID=A0A6J4SXC8_9ACTN|nr:MAG: hypothetical protein AVDCRST_MAG85-2140 [uncultured Solirubrobacteraceae bacterium]